MRLPATFRIMIVFGLLLSLAAGCASGGGISVKEPFSRPAPSAGGNGGAFLTIVNGGQQADRLVSAQCPAAMMVELHETIDDAGVMRMRPQPDGFEIPAGGKVELKPGGKHIMLMNLKAPLKAGDTIDITLNFEKAGAVTVKVPVREQ